MMERIFYRILLVFFFSSCSIHFLQADTFQEQRKANMIQDLAVIKHNFEAGYAPAEWKKECFGWDLNESFEKAKQQILTTPSITTKQFHRIVRDFVGEMKDYHVNVIFFSTEAASLPFSVKEVEGRYVIDWVDPIRLPCSYYGLREGDELLAFNEQPIKEVIADLEKTISPSSNPATDKALASMKLTIRKGMFGDIVPKGSILITTRSQKNAKITTHQLCWSYTPEKVNSPFDFFLALDFLPWLSSSKDESEVEFMKIAMAAPVHQNLAKECAERDGALGSRKSFLPPLGDVLWLNEEHVTELNGGMSENSKSNDKEKTDDLLWHAYIYHHPHGYQVGYIRIPHYELSLRAIKEFGILMNVMEENTDALVIDQLHNFGGFIDCQYMLASMLTDQPLQAPYHRIKITQKEVFTAYKDLESIKKVEMAVAAAEEKEMKNEKDFNFQEMLFWKAHCENLLEDWNKGKTMTEPTPIAGVDRINPHPKYRYSKPIVMLIDEMDFSGGDFMPAILQDNQRALLFGSRTAGAGGYVFSFQFPNSNGIAKCSYTASLAERMDSQKIENLGVFPDIPYQITWDDVQNGYEGYIESVNQAINSLLQQSETN